MNNRLSIVGHDPGQKQWHVTRAAVTTFNFFTRIFVAHRSFSKQGCLKKNTEETHTVCIASHYMSVAQPTHPQSSATLQSKLISKVMVESAPKVASPAHLHEGRSIFVAAHENMLVSVKHIQHDTPGSSFQIIDSQICIIPYSGTMNIEVTFSQNIFFNSSMGLQPNMSR